MDPIPDQLASASGQREQDINIRLAQKIAAGKDTKAITALVEGLQHKTKAIRHDCIKVLYEIAGLDPSLLVAHAGTFILLLENKHNRMQWGAMTALSAMTPEIPELLFEALDKIILTMDSGSVITRDHGVLFLVRLSQLEHYRETTIPLLLEQLLQAPDNQVPFYAEQALPIISPAYKARFEQAINSRLQGIAQESKKKRLEKVLKKLSLLK